MSDVKKTKKSSTKHIADVQEPGMSAPSETSRPVIVTNRPLLRDPMVVGKKNNGEDENLSQKPSETLSSSGKPDLQPLDNSITPDEEVAEASAQKPVLPPTEEEAPAASQQPEETQALLAAGEADASPEPSPAASSETTPELVDNQSAEGMSKNAAAKKAEAEAAERTKHDAALQELIASKQYALPINSAEKRKNKKVVILGIALCVILVLAWLDVALDAGIIKLGGLKSATHFFSN